MSTPSPASASVALSAEPVPPLLTTEVPKIVDFGSLPWNSSAVVLWLVDGETPNGTEHFCGDAALSPLECNPLAWWDLGQAVTHAGTHRNSHGKRPWIKAGEVILSPTDVLRSYDFYKHHGTRK